MTVLPSQDWSRCVVGVVVSEQTQQRQAPLPPQSSQLDDMQVENPAQHPPTSQSALSAPPHLHFDLEWAHHMNLPAVLLPPIEQQRGGGSGSGVAAASDVDVVVPYARAVAQACIKASSFSFQLWVPIRLNAASLQQYQAVYRLSGENHHVSSALVLEPVDVSPFDNPADYQAHQLQLVHVAVGCNIRCVVVPAAIFLTNKKGFPTLPKMTQTIVAELMRRIGRTVRFVVEGPGRHDQLPPPHCGTTKCLPYLQYLQHLRRRLEVTAVIDSEEAMLESRYLDVLQRPLQPLKDHLEFGTYEVFEKDPVKYAQYERAVALAMHDMITVHASSSTSSGAQPLRCSVHVVGAGRGPLVSCVLRAYQSVAQLTGIVDLAVVAVEKNPSAALYLQGKVRSDPLWQMFADRIRIVHKDLRFLSLADVGNRQCDVVVSELLGSFGCNELSPECLDVFLRNSEICHGHTVSIPQSYTSFLSSVHSSALQSEARQQALYPNDTESGVIGMQAAMETPYVVRPHAASQMCAEQPCWTFQHPAPSSSSSSSSSPSGAAWNERSVVLDFGSSRTHGAGYATGYGALNAQLEAHAKLSESAENSVVTPTDGTVSTLSSGSSTHRSTIGWTLTGLLGTFSADLYRSRQTGEVCQISTAPNNFSVGMFSWFPLYFPLAESLWVPPGASVKAWMWRCADSSRIWYEWSVAVLDRNGNLIGTSAVHNPVGRSYHVSVSSS